jgi:hypothetical protein
MTEQLPANTLKGEIARGLADLVEGRVQDFDVTRIVECGRERLASRAFQTLRDVQQKP